VFLKAPDLAFEGVLLRGRELVEGCPESFQSLDDIQRTVLATLQPTEKRRDPFLGLGGVAEEFLGQCPEVFFDMVWAVAGKSERREAREREVIRAISSVG